MRRNGRWWNSLGSGAWRSGAAGSVPFQGTHSTVSAIPEPIARLIYEEYHHDQTFERLHERGGFGVGEAIAALADIIERERSISRLKVAQSSRRSEVDTSEKDQVTP